MSYTWLPPLLNQIADVAGLDAALALANARGGSRVSFPAKLPKEHWLIDCVGHDAAALICEEFRGGNYGGQVDLPVGPTGSANAVRRAVDQMIKDGMSADQIAMKMKVHRTTVFRRKANLCLKDNQPDLFSTD